MSTKKHMYNGNWIYGLLFCDLFMMFDVFFCTASIMNLTAISLDRYVAVSHPLQYARHNNTIRVSMTLVIVWLLSFGISLPIVCGLNHIDRDQLSKSCEFLNADFIIYSSLGSFFLPAILMIGLYYRIFRVIRRQSLALRISEHKPEVIENNIQTLINNNHLNEAHRRYNELKRSILTPCKSCTTYCNNSVTVNPKIINKTALSHSIHNSHIGKSGQSNSHQKSSQSFENYYALEQSCLSNQYDQLNNNITFKCQTELPTNLQAPGLHKSATDNFKYNISGATWSNIDRLKYSKDQIFCNPGDISFDLNVLKSPHLSASSTFSMDPFTYSDIDEQPDNIQGDNFDTNLLSDIPRKPINKFKNSRLARGFFRNKVKRISRSVSKKLSPLKRNIRSHKVYHQCIQLTEQNQSCVDEETCRFICQPFKKWQVQFIFNCNLRKRKVIEKKKQEKNAIKREKKAIKTLAIVLGVFLFCWTPFFVANMTNALCFKTVSRGHLCPLPSYLMSVCVWLGYMNSFLNPVIYTVCNTEFRRIFKKLLHIS